MGAPATIRFQIRSTHRYAGEPASQKVTWSAICASFSATARRSHSSSPFVAAASGGGGTRKSLPEEIAHVFQVPALGSICWANTGSVESKNTLSVSCFIIRDMAVLLLIDDSRDPGKLRNPLL